MLRRRDFRESSRIVTCLTREHGKITGLAKGAHRPDSPMLGRIDFLNEVEATFSADRGGLRLLTRAKLTRERRALRQPRRFLAAGVPVDLELALRPERPLELTVVDESGAAQAGVLVEVTEVGHTWSLGTTSSTGKVVARGLGDGECAFAVYAGPIPLAEPAWQALEVVRFDRQEAQLIVR